MIMLIMMIYGVYYIRVNYTLYNALKYGHKTPSLMREENKNKIIIIL